MTRTLLEYFPAGGGEPVAFTTGPAAEYRLLDVQGLGPVAAAPQMIKSPGQTGETAVDVILPPRVVSVQGLIQAASGAILWPLRASLARALVQQPTRFGETISMGRLRLTLPGRTPLELDCLPTSVDMAHPPGRSTLNPVDAEFVAPYPYWRETADSRLDFTSASGGFEFSAEFPLEMGSLNVEQEVDNQGDVDSPVLIRLYGDVTTARVMNLTTGQTIEITGQIPAGDYIEIDTAFGQKAVTLVDGTTRTSEMDRLNLNLADFWTLRPGLNTVRFEADTNVSGRAELYWRQRYSGV